MCTGAGNERGNSHRSTGACGSKWELHIVDVFQTSRHPYAVDSDYFTTFLCSVCGHWTDINVDAIHPYANLVPFPKWKALHKNDEMYAKWLK